MAPLLYNIPIMYGKGAIFRITQLVGTASSAVSVLIPGTCNNNGRQQKLQTLKKSQLFIELLFICLSNLNFLQCSKLYT